MFKFWKALMALALVLAVAQPVLADEPPIAKGAKTLFGESSDTAFLPREQGGTAGSARMDPTNRVDDDMLASSIHAQPDFPGIAYSLEVIRKGESFITTVKNPRRYEFRTGDRLRMRVIPNFTGFAYVLQAQGNDSSLVYPASAGTTDNMVTAGHECYVPAEGGWLRLTDPAAPFTMRVLFKPAAVGSGPSQPTPSPRSQPTPNPPYQPTPDMALASLKDAVARQWEATAGQKGLVFEADNSRVEAATQGETVDHNAAGQGDEYWTTYVVAANKSSLPVDDDGDSEKRKTKEKPGGGQGLPEDNVDSDEEKTKEKPGGGQGLPEDNVDSDEEKDDPKVDVRPHDDPTSGSPPGQPSIAIEVPIRHVG